MDTSSSLENLTPMATFPLHPTVLVTLINPDSEQCGKEWHYSHPPHCVTH